jgi:asparagine synthase (glutamine-hydrolysing)
MAETIYHRGPDDEGYYVSGPVGLGFRRLSIIDLNTGHQPICNEDGSVWIVFNGEIYNYRELRNYLQSKGHVFKTKTDTEVIVHLYEELGEACLGKLRGMFAFAIWDDRRKTLLLARDRVGIKPLYYYLSDNSVIFASEIKAILADPEVTPEVVPAMIDRFLTFYFVPGEQTLFRNIYKLPPGAYMVIKDGRAQTKLYWDLHFSPERQTVAQAERTLLELLEESVRLHMIADVPVGFLLSGGVDSTAMLDFAVGKTDQKLSSFTLGFSEPGLADERPFARLAASQYGTEHYETTITAKEFADFLPQFAWYMEEPVCEPQAVALYYVSKLAKRHVKVLISGEGGDEAFAGYQTYRGVVWLERLKSLMRPWNRPLSACLEKTNHMLGSARLRKYGPLLRLHFEDYYYSRTSNPFTFFNTHANELYSKEFMNSTDKGYSLAPVIQYLANRGGGGKINKMLYVDTKTSLPDDLLLKADKMTMANSIELRVPFLDHKILEFAATLPENFKLRGFTTKFIAKQALRHRVPREILHRKKAGFPVPYESWFRGDLKDWISAVLLDRQTLSRGYFSQRGIERMISNDFPGAGLSRELFSLAALEFWHRAFLDGKRPAPKVSTGSARVSVK